MAGEQFSLCWDNFHKNMSSGMHSLLESEDLVDVTLAVEGKYLKAHKMVLSVCSPYFRELFQMNPCKHPIVFMKDVSYTAMNDLLTFMYQGEVQVNQEQLTMFIKTAEALQIKGLTNDGNNESTEISDDHVEEVVPESKASATITHENDVVLKPTTKVKKSTSHPSAKRQRIASPVVDKRSPVTSKIESKPTEQHTTDHLIQFKMEPYEADQSDQAQAEGYEENPDDNFADDGVDEAHMDDSEYQETILKGEEEPQAGTSGDGMGESQGVVYFFPGVKLPLLFFDNHQYKVERRRDDSTIWRCTGYETNKCKARLKTYKDNVYFYNLDHTDTSVEKDLTKCSYSRVMKLNYKKARRDVRLLSRK